MTFNSVPYGIFLAVVVTGVWAMPARWRNSALVLASYVFYASWDWRFLALIVTSTAIGYTSGLALGRETDQRKRTRILAARVTLNLVLLGVFKYLDFFIDSAVGIADAVGLGMTGPSVRIILPIAISYMTFEEIAYAMDVYRRQLQPTRSLVDYALFVAFFPKLVAGPILRPRELLPQIGSDRAPPDRHELHEGIALIMMGLFKKVVIADTMARVANPLFRDPTSSSGLALLVGVYAFAIQIYGDFSGYSDIARGSARLLGFHLPVNFRQPYLSNSVTAFWRTWHISLSSWLRDYLYVPLGGNRRSPRRTMINLFLVMLIGGLWHGAAWTFVAWGALHGTYLAVERWTGTDRRHDNADRAPVLRDLPRIVLTFHLVCLAWILFRAPSFTDAARYVGAMVRGGPFLSQGKSSLLVVAVAAVVMTSIDLWQRRAGSEVPTLRPSIARGVLLGTACLAVVAFSGAPSIPFIYFQF